MELVANTRNIEAEQRSSLEMEFTITDADLVGKNIIWILQRSERSQDPILIKDQDSMTVDGDTASLILSVDDTDWARDRWYELWVNWGGEQWQKQFKGRFKLNPSGNYQQS